MKKTKGAAIYAKLEPKPHQKRTGATLVDMAQWQNSSPSKALSKVIQKYNSLETACSRGPKQFKLGLGRKFSLSFFRKSFREIHFSFSRKILYEKTKLSRKFSQKQNF
jgi:hypothetical protein